MSWQKYFKIDCQINVLGQPTGHYFIRWADDEKEGPPPRPYSYRTERLAIRAAERLYRGILRDMENALGLGE